MVCQGVAPEESGHLLSELASRKHAHGEAPWRLRRGAVAAEIQCRLKVVVFPSRSYGLVPHHAAGNAACIAEAQANLRCERSEEESACGSVAV